MKFRKIIVPLLVKPASYDRGKQNSNGSSIFTVFVNELLGIAVACQDLTQDAAQEIRKRFMISKVKSLKENATDTCICKFINLKIEKLDTIILQFHQKIYLGNTQCCPRSQNNWFSSKQFFMESRI